MPPHYTISCLASRSAITTIVCGMVLSDAYLRNNPAQVHVYVILQVCNWIPLQPTWDLIIIITEFCLLSFIHGLKLDHTVTWNQTLFSCLDQTSMEPGIFLVLVKDTHEVPGPKTQFLFTCCIVELCSNIPAGNV